MVTTSILDVARDLIQAIDQNKSFSNELEILRDWVKNGTLERRQTD